LAQAVKAEPVPCRVPGIIGQVWPLCDGHFFKIPLQGARIPALAGQVELELSWTQFVGCGQKQYASRFENTGSLFEAVFPICNVFQQLLYQANIH
jgi:hypothetical protein